MTRMDLAHANEAQVSKVRMPISIPVGESRQLLEVVATIEGQSHELFAHHREHERDVVQVKGGLGQHGFARQRGFGDPVGDTNRPLMVLVIPIGECDQKSSVGNGFHDRENPFREDRSFGPRTEPARRMNA